MERLPRLALPEATDVVVYGNSAHLFLSPVPQSLLVLVTPSSNEKVPS